MCYRSYAFIMQVYYKFYCYFYFTIFLIDLPFFPIKPEESDETEGKEECCVCYEYYLGDKLPDVICENTTCESRFHAECLYQVIISYKNR